MAKRGKVVRKAVEVKEGRGVDDVAEYVRREHAELLDRIYNPEKYKKKTGSTESTKLEEYLEPDDVDEEDNKEVPGEESQEENKEESGEE